MTRAFIINTGDKERTALLQNDLGECITQHLHTRALQGSPHNLRSIERSIERPSSSFMGNTIVFMVSKNAKNSIACVEIFEGRKTIGGIGSVINKISGK